jgi:hypothetical protein
VSLAVPVLLGVTLAVTAVLLVAVAAAMFAVPV